jgi:hypothetical protein
MAEIALILGGAILFGLLYLLLPIQNKVQYGLLKGLGRSKGPPDYKG